MSYWAYLMRQVFYRYWPFMMTSAIGVFCAIIYVVKMLSVRHLGKETWFDATFYDTGYLLALFLVFLCTLLSFIFCCEFLFNWRRKIVALLLVLVFLLSLLFVPKITTEYLSSRRISHAEDIGASNDRTFQGIAVRNNA
jgi:hypothetical protein